MGEKHSILISDSLYQDIKEYCQLNNIKTNEFINNMLREGFMIEKYGTSPFDNFRKKIEDDTVEIKSVSVSNTNNQIPKDLVPEIEMEVPTGQLIYAEKIDPTTLTHVYEYEVDPTILTHVHETEVKEQQEVADKMSEKQNKTTETPKIEQTENHNKSEKPNKRRLK